MSHKAASNQLSKLANTTLGEHHEVPLDHISKFVWHLFGPCLGHEHLSDLQYRAVIRELANEALADCGVPAKPVGQKRILAMDPHTKPEHTDKSPAPLCHSGCTEKKREFKAAFREFVSAYKEAYQRILKHSLKEEFPDGALPPTAWCVSLTPG